VAARHPNLRVLPDNFSAAEQSVVITKGDPSRLDAINRFIAEARASGLVKASLDRAKLIEEQQGRLDALVNNAARFTRFDPMEITEANWDFIHSVNLKAVFFCCQQGAKLMRKSGGGPVCWQR
jgi:NAD(P)-dependent dehydrogenase (short-subunit alcohol dehydrogenase family)